MSVYENDDPNYFRNGVESIINQTMLPNEIVLVIDGYINNKLEVYQWMKKTYDTDKLSFWILDVPLLYIPDILFKIPYLIYRIYKYKVFHTNKVISTKDMKHT